MDDEAFTIRLTRDQAFVLSDWLYQVMFQSDDLEGIVRDRAVWSPIYAISGTLDKRLSEIFMPDYAPRLEAAKERLRINLYGKTDESTAPNKDAATAPQAHQTGRGTAGSHGESTKVDKTSVRSFAQLSG
ncbi:hypothetical protein ABT124_42545 [Streptomyces sp. NPDC001982]|uniref:hypothetical protein n=1 Tax=Streptomyces sp. NPDC001982 TaxID=3154405 RepID=UPI00331D13A5